jgi:hypothetical protein
VFSIVLIEQAKVHLFLAKLVSQLKGLLMLSERREFPPLESALGRQYSSTNTLVSLSVCGSVAGWRAAKAIPFFPGWIGAIAGAASAGYAGTFQDGRGDFLRFLGHTVCALLGEVSAAAGEVALREKFAVLFSLLARLVKTVDGQFDLAAKGQALMQVLVRIVSSLLVKNPASRTGGVGEGIDRSTSGGRRKYIDEEVVDLKVDEEVQYGNDYASDPSTDNYSGYEQDVPFPKNGKRKYGRKDR